MESLHYHCTEKNGSIKKKVKLHHCINSSEYMCLTHEILRCIFVSPFLKIRKINKIMVILLKKSLVSLKFVCELIMMMHHRASTTSSFYTLLSASG